MDLNTSDPYEQKLYNMFKSFDNESKDSLDKESLINLCIMLELKDRGSKLVSNLLDDNKNNRVTFREFKEGLLNLLGTDGDDDNCEIAQETSFNKEVNDINKNSNQIESKSREVSPKLIVGGKKYGRRSRPQSAVAFDSSQSDSEEDSTATDRSRSRNSQRVQRSVSQSDVHGNNGRRVRPTIVGNPSTTKLKRCASLPAQKRQIIVNTNVDVKNLKAQLESSVESLDHFDFDVLSNGLYDEWKKCERLTTNTINNNNMNRTRTELVEIFQRVGLQTLIASKVADEIYIKMNLSTEQTISFNDLLSFIQNDSERLRQSTITATTNHEETDNNKRNDDLYVVSPTSNARLIDDSMMHLITNDLHAHSDEPADWSTETMSVEQLIDFWEMSHVKNAATLLDDLGFTSDKVNLSKLSTIIDEEIHDIHNNEKEITPLLRASVSLCKKEINALQKTVRHASYENKQLHANVRELNRRSFMLAQEVDERHANLEISAREELRQLDQRHTEIIRDLTAQMANDREHWSQLNAKLEKRIKQFESDEGKRKLEVQQYRNENSALEREQEQLQNQVTELLEMNIKLNNEIADMVQRNDDPSNDGNETDEMLQLMDKITKLQMENAGLRDKNDEFTSEIEELHIELNKLKMRKQMRSEQYNSGGEDNASSSGEGSNLSSASATKRRGDSPSKAKLSEESPRLGKLRKYHNDNSEGESETSGDWMALNSELNQSVTLSQTTGTTSGFSQDYSSLNDQKDEEIKELRIKINKLNAELDTMKQSTNDNNETKNVPEIMNVDKIKQYTDRIKELEASLEQMQNEYEACEDYWQGKLNEERVLYDEEQRISDEKFNELLKKMTEYEEQFASSGDKEGRLTPIDEKCQLEQQYADLENEMEEFRERASKIFHEKQNQVDQLLLKIREFELRLGCESTIAISSSSKVSDNESVASSPISYLWNQGTIQAPTRDYQNPKWNQIEKSNEIENEPEIMPQPIAPIQRPHSPSTSGLTLSTTTLKNTAIENTLEDGITDILDDDSSLRSFATHSVASTHSIHRSLPEVLSSSPNMLREDIKRLKLIELQLKDDVKGLAHQRDGLVMELQQLQEAKPVLEKAYARTPHPSLIQKIQQLENKNRQLQFCLKQQQQYTESIMHQTWQQQRTEINELRGTLETQGIIINEQAQRLASSDMLVKDLYVENSQLTAAIQRLEQQRTRSNMLLQHQGVGSVPGML